MKCSKMLALGLLAVCAATTAGASASIETSAGSKSLLFAFSGLSDLGVSSFTGNSLDLSIGNQTTDLRAAGIGARKYINDGTAIRPTVTFGISSSKDKSQDSDRSDAKLSVMAIGVSCALEKHKDVGVSSLSPYLGVGAGLDIISGSFEPSLADNPPDGTRTKAKASATSFGLFGAAGFEWGFTEGATLGGEYRLGLGMTSGKQEDEIEGEGTVTNSETSSLGLGFDTASVFFSVKM